MPIHMWLVEHGGRRLLVDAGATTAASDLPFIRYSVTASDELPRALSAVGLAASDLDTVILTHLHSDHADGAVHAPGPVLVSDVEWRTATSALGRLAQRISRAPIPDGVDFRPTALTDGPFGAFTASLRLTGDGRVRAVATPGHTAGHLSVVAIDDEGRHVLLAGDATDSLEQLHARRADPVAPRPSLQVETIDRILAHGRDHPTVYLPAHDHESRARLAAGTTL
jgi:glyoxylase-like metal-dependent hydrolase (beta-lactamase superfamily II)